MSRFNQTIEIMTGSITKLEIQKKRKDRVNIFLEGQYAYSCHVDLIFEFKLDKGIYMSSEASKSLIEADDLKMAYLYGLKIALTRAISVNGCRKKLQTYEFSPSSIDYAIEQLLSNEYLDDEKYALHYFEVKKNLYGRHRIVQELTRQGVEKAIIQQVVHSLADDDQEYEEALRVGLKKLESLGKDLDHKAYSKIYGLLGRKGYSSSVIRRVMDVLRTSSKSTENEYEDLF